MTNLPERREMRISDADRDEGADRGDARSSGVGIRIMGGFDNSGDGAGAPGPRGSSSGDSRSGVGVSVERKPADEELKRRKLERKREKLERRKRLAE